MNASNAPEDHHTLVGCTALVEGSGSASTGLVSRVDGPVVTVACDERGWSGELGRAVVSVFAPDALYRIDGLVTEDGAQVTTAAGSPVERIQRRRWPRRRMDLPVVVCPVADGRRLEGVPGRTVDISLGGVCVETLRPVEGEGDPMVIVSLPDGNSLVSITTTVAADDLGDGWRYRLAFRDLDAHDAARLADVTAAPGPNS